jgi:predicted Zn-dependent protease
MKYLMAVLLMSALTMAADGKHVRVFLTDQQTWAEASNLVAPAQTFAASRTEQIHNIAKYCPAVTVTGEASSADFVLVWTTTPYAQTRWGGHEHEWAVYNQKKDVIGTGAEYHMKNAAKDICKALTK